ncbi:SIR2 family protein [Chryseobacterium sp. cx-311]|uniref:SIR2 family protein n=1 Tax=Marnyiella aurantia TaxID=2758037 RepID=UPI001AE79795|nr:SIR2 family protein [Marnyiella aurantia]MBP0613928.1 SIR2 family protein [Marnyiella aurantia]
MKFSNEINIFINDYVKDLNGGTASIFAGAGLSIPAGFVNWTDLMSEIATDLGLDLNIEKDLISIAQYHVNENQNRTKINRKILEEFTEDVSETENHKIISRLPLSSIWTTNYDQLIESAIEKEYKIVDVKFTIDQLLTTRPKRDVIVFKMHGDVKHPNDAILTKQQYEQYYQTHEPFINALSGELTTKTFLFVGFSFNDPNLDYVLSRLNFRFRHQQRQHYCFVKVPKIGDYSITDKASLDYSIKKQNLIVNDLKRYGIKSLRIENYSDITAILEEIEKRYKKQSVFISGSAEVYDPLDRNSALGFIHNLSKVIIRNDYRIVNGFGWGVGSSVINGALEEIYNNPKKHSESQLILKPFPQFEMGKKKLGEMWEDYRQNIISKCGIAIFLFGNKNVEGKIEIADGVIREFEIANANGCICIPIGLTGYASLEIFKQIMAEQKKYYEKPAEIITIIKTLSDSATTLDSALEQLDKLLKQLKKN